MPQSQKCWLFFVFACFSVGYIQEAEEDWNIMEPFLYKYVLLAKIQDNFSVLP